MKTETNQYEKRKPYAIPTFYRVQKQFRSEWITNKRSKYLELMMKTKSFLVILKIESNSLSKPYNPYSISNFAIKWFEIEWIFCWKFFKKGFLVIKRIVRESQKPVIFVLIALNMHFALGNDGKFIDFIEIQFSNGYCTWYVGSGGRFSVFSNEWSENFLITIWMRLFSHSQSALIRANTMATWYSIHWHYISLCVCVYEKLFAFVCNFHPLNGIVQIEPFQNLKWNARENVENWNEETGEMERWREREGEKSKIETLFEPFSLFHSSLFLACPGRRKKHQRYQTVYTSLNILYCCNSCKRRLLYTILSLCSMHFSMHDRQTKKVQRVPVLHV